MKPTRRHCILAAGGLPLLRGGSTFRYAICSETFTGIPFNEACRLAKQIGYAGIEVAPFTITGNPAALSRAGRRELRDVIQSEGLEFVGLHSFLTAPKGLHLTGPDAALRQRSWLYFRSMIDFCADLGDGGVLVLGSSRERSAAAGVSVAEATARLREGLAGMVPHALARQVTILLEPLASHVCNVVNTVGEAVAIVKQVDSPALQTMFDTHNAVDETEPHPAVIRKFYPYLRHVHVNELDGRYPGAGTYDFGSVLKVFRELGYRRWVSVEVFNFEPSGAAVTRAALAHLTGKE